MLRLLAMLTRGSPVSLNAEYIPGADNKVADTLSRIENLFVDAPSHRTSAFFSEFPQTRGFVIYQPSPKLLSAIWCALLNGKLPDRLLKKIRERRGVDETFLGRFVPLEASTQL